MIRTYVTSALAGAFVLGAATVALAATGQFDNMCSWGLANHKDVADGLLHQRDAQGQDVLLQQRRRQSELHEESRRQSCQGRDLLQERAQRLSAG